MTETGVIAMYIRGREGERLKLSTLEGEREQESIYGSEGEREGGRREVAVCKKYTFRRTNTSLKRLSEMHALTDGEQWKYTLENADRMQMKVSDCIPSFLM